ncbi:tape measure protein [Holdemanella sp.]|uniref:tape measure protein n=1 Tax=Holdemanella sp. TaxID=1971762 RepID=UPI003AF01D05
MMASGESYKVNVTLSANDKNLSKTLSSVTKQSDSFLSKLKNSAVFGAFASVGASAMRTVTSAISGTISELSASNVAWKTFEGNMQMLGQSSGEINKAKKALQQYATQTIYSASDMSQTYSQLAAVGTKNCLRLVKGFGGLASAAENPKQAMKTLSQQGTQMAAKPMVAWQDFKLMLEQTPAGIAAVAREMGMSTSELVSAVQNGTVKTEDFFNAVEKAGNSKAFTKMATQYKSVGQAMDGLKETLANKLMPAYDKLSKIGIKALSSIIDGLDGFDANILTNGIDKVIDTFKRFGKAFESTDAIKAFKQALSDVGGAIKNVMSQFKDTGLIEKFGQAFGQVVKFVSQAISAVSKFIGKLNGAQLGGIVGSVLGVVGGFKAFNFLKDFNPFGIFKKNAEIGVEGVAKATKTHSSKAMRTLKDLSISYKNFGKGTSDRLKGLGQMLKVANPVNILALGGALFMVAAGIALIGESGNGLSSIAESLGKAFSEVIATTIDAVTQALIALAPVLPTICDAFAQLSPLVEAFGDAFGTVIESVGNAIANIVNAIGPVIESVVQIIANAIVQIVQAIAPFAPVIADMVQAISDAIQSICDAFIALVQNIQPIIESVKDLVQQLGDSISQVFDSASDVITSFGDAVSGILDSIAGVIDSIGQSALNAGKGFKELAKGIQIITNLNLLDMAASLGAVATGVGAIATASSGIGDAGTQIMNLAIGLGLMVGYTDSLSGLASVMPNVINSFSGIESISGPLASASGAMIQFASSASGLVGSTTIASSALIALGVALTQVAIQGGQAGTQLGTKFKTGLQSGLTQSVSIARSMSRNITSALKSASSGAYSVGQMIGNGLANGMASTLGRVSAIATRLAQEAEKATRAAAKVHSPSRVFMLIGNYIGKGFAIGIEQTERMVRKATESIVNIPSAQSLDGYGFRMDGVSNVNSTTYDFNSNQNFTFNSTLTLDGRTLAKASNRYTEEELNKSAKFKERLAGVV